MEKNQFTGRILQDLIKILHPKLVTEQAIKIWKFKIRGQTISRGRMTMPRSSLSSAHIYVSVTLREKTIIYS